MFLNLVKQLKQTIIFSDTHLIHGIKSILVEAVLEVKVG
jgi:hypothetical protein